MNTQPFDKLPWRLFLDSSTLQALHSYGEFIYDGGSIDPKDRIWLMPNGPENIQGLKEIMFVGKRASLELVLSANSLKEVAQRQSPSYLRWAFEVVDYWESLLAGYRESGVPPFKGLGASLGVNLESPSFGYLGKKDKALLVDAVVLECEAFITLDRNLCQNRLHFESRVPLRILEPLTYSELLRQWAPLFV